MTQEALGERAGLSYKFVGEVERGLANPTLDSLERLGEALGVPVEEIVRSEKGIYTYRPISPADYSMVREARDAIDTVLQRYAPPRGRKR